ncbi:NAD(+)/NADH kinase [Haloimpatiens sp. FM7315]|uniref:NAD(+)/NADH kinase n=1 Tax=Haloimpatiens sp. FM7315 TaxID=3298609 RepID=UPI00370B1116
MKNIGININSEKDPENKILNDILKILGNECKIFVFNDCRGIPEKSSQLDMILSIGGDGTTLRTARSVVKNAVPILSVNFGNLGFLTTAEGTNLESTLNKVLNNQYYIEDRMMLECDFKGGNSRDKLFSLNDIVLCKGTLSRVVNYELSIDDKIYNSLVADGIIISTPTGSTAYSLSAGGPIIYPTLDVISITPICPLFLNMRSFILNSDNNISLKISDTNEPVFLTIDGQEAFELCNDNKINIRKSKYKTKLIKTYDYDYFSTLRKKIISRIKE